jgi:hypothetical protein
MFNTNTIKAGFDLNLPPGLPARHEILKMEYLKNNQKWKICKLGFIEPVYGRNWKVQHFNISRRDFCETRISQCPRFLQMEVNSSMLYDWFLKIIIVMVTVNIILCSKLHWTSTKVFLIMQLQHSLFKTFNICWVGEHWDQLRLLVMTIHFPNLKTVDQSIM